MNVNKREKKVRNRCQKWKMRAPLLLMVLPHHRGSALAGLNGMKGFPWRTSGK